MVLLLKVDNKTQVCPPSCFTTTDLLEYLGPHYQLSSYVTAAGKVINGLLPQEGLLEIHLRLLGGKGGFGAKLKHEGGKKVRPNDNAFSRDALGRRLVHATVQKQFIDYCKRKIEEDKKIEEERSNFQAIQGTLLNDYSHRQLDQKYTQALESTEKSLVESIKLGQAKLVQIALAEKQASALNSQSQKLAQSSQKTQTCHTEANLNVQATASPPVAVSKYQLARDKLKAMFKK